MEIKTDDKVKKGVNVNRATAAYFTKIAAFLEFFVAAILLVVILAGAILLAVNLTGDLIHNPQLVDLNQVLGDALALVVGIEFIKMLVKHAPEAVVEVLLFAIAREMVVTHAGSAETLPDPPLSLPSKACTGGRRPGRVTGVELQDYGYWN